MDVENQVASIVIEDLFERISKTKVNENQVLIISDLSFNVLEAIYNKLINSSKSSINVKGNNVPTIIYKNSEIIPYLINEREGHVKRSQAFAGKLRNSLETKDDIVKWLVIIGEPEYVEIDTFTTTGRSIVEKVNNKKSYFDFLFEKYIKSSTLSDSLKIKAQELRSTIFANSLDEHSLKLLINYFQNVISNGNNETAMSRNLSDLKLLPSENEDALKSYNIKRNLEFCSELTSQLNKLEDLDFWVEENVNSDERENFRSLLRNHRNDTQEILGKISQEMKLERLINLDQPDESPLFFVKNIGINIVNGVKPFIPGNTNVLELIDEKIVINYSFTRLPDPETNQIGISINDSECISISGFDNKEGIVELDLKTLNILEEIEDSRIHKLTIGIVNPEKPYSFKKNDRGKVSRFEFVIYPNLQHRSWNIYEVNEAYTVKNKQCIFQWNEQLIFNIIGDSEKLKAELYVESENIVNESDEGENSRKLISTMDIHDNQVIIGPSELKQIRKIAFSKESEKQEAIVDLEVSDSVGNLLIMSFLVGPESDLKSSTQVKSIQEGIIRYLHQDNKVQMEKDQILKKYPSSFEIKILGTFGNHIRFRLLQKENEDNNSHVYSIYYPLVIRDIEKDFLNNPLDPFPRTYDATNNELFKKNNPNWDKNFTGIINEKLELFLNTRKKIFETIIESSKNFKGLISVDLLSIEELVDDYLNDFYSLMSAIARDKVLEQHSNILMIDTVFVSDEKVILLSPTHPLKLKAALLLQKHCLPLQNNEQKPRNFAYTLGNIQLWNHQYTPPFLKLKSNYYKASPSSLLFWGIYERTDGEPVNFEQNKLLSLFNISANANIGSRFTEAIRNRIEIFLTSYPFLEQMHLPISINCFLTNESTNVIEAIYNLAKNKGNLAWKINFIIPKAFDSHNLKERLKNKINSFRESISINDEELSVLKKIDYTIQEVDLELCNQHDIPYAHISLLSNLFETTITQRAVNSFTSSLKNESLTAIPKTFYAYEEKSYYTGISLNNSENLFEKTLAKYLSVIACYDLPYQEGLALFSRTNLQPNEMKKVDKIVQRSIWVCFLEKEIGIEKFDNINDIKNSYYLVDYLNKYSSKIEGYDLLTITNKRSEIISLIKNHLVREKYNLEARTDVAEELLNAVNCLSGRWAMKLIGGGHSEVSGLIGSLQVFMFYKKIIKMFEPIFNEDNKVVSVMVPLDEYMAVSPRRRDGWFEENKEENFKSCSDDFLLIKIEEKTSKVFITGKIIEVKFSKEQISGPIITKAKEQLYNSKRILENRFIMNKFNKTFKQSELAELIYFHVMKFMRNDIYGKDERIKNNVKDFIQGIFGKILENNYSIDFSYQEGSEILEGEIVAVSPGTHHSEGYAMYVSDNRRIIYLYDKIIKAIFNQDEVNTGRFNNIKSLINPIQIESPATFHNTTNLNNNISNNDIDETTDEVNNNREDIGEVPNQEAKNSNNKLIGIYTERESDGFSNNPEIAQQQTEKEKNYIENEKLLWIGTDNKGDRVLIPPQILTKHMAVLGSTGSGKTRFAKSFIEELTRQDIPSLIIDPQGDIARLIEFKNSETPEALKFFEKAEVRIFTPASNKGIQFSFNPIQMPKEDILSKLKDSFEREEYLITVFDSTATNLLAVLSKQDDQAHAFLVMVLEKLFRVGISDLTIENLANYIYNNDHFPLEMPDDELEMFISKGNKLNLVRELNKLTIGTNRSLFNLGFKFNIDQLLKPVHPGKVPVNIIYLNSLDTDQKKQFCVSVICNELYKWMLKNPSPNLQLAFYIDEVGPYMPPQNVKKPASKDILMRLYKESRKYGIGCILCTQQPGDVDSKILNNANTWAIGKILPKHFESIKKLINDSGSKEVPGISEVSNFPSGEFIVLSGEAFPETQFEKFKVRDLYTEHKSPYTLEDLEDVIPIEFREFFAK